MSFDQGSAPGELPWSAALSRREIAYRVEIGVANIGT